MSDPIEPWKTTAIENLTIGETYRVDDFLVCRYRDGWHFFWKHPKRSDDLARVFDTDHIIEMRKFMAGDWSLGNRLHCPNVYGTD